MHRVRAERKLRIGFERLQLHRDQMKVCRIWKERRERNLQADVIGYLRAYRIMSKHLTSLLSSAVTHHQNSMQRRAFIGLLRNQKEQIC